MLLKVPNFLSLISICYQTKRGYQKPFIFEFSKPRSRIVGTFVHTGKWTVEQTPPAFRIPDSPCPSPCPSRWHCSCSRTGPTAFEWSPQKLGARLSLSRFFLFFYFLFGPFCGSYVNFRLWNSINMSAFDSPEKRSTGDGFWGRGPLSPCGVSCVAPLLLPLYAPKRPRQQTNKLKEKQAKGEA